MPHQIKKTGHIRPVDLRQTPAKTFDQHQLHVQQDLERVLFFVRLLT
ncbi:MAG: hypothetical protein ACOYKC_02740 [Anaerolineaceae bacterium]